MSAFGVVIGDVVADFELGFGQARKAAAIEQFGFEAAPKGSSVGVVVAVAPPAHTLLGAVLGDQGFEAGGRVLAALVGMHDEPGQGAAQRLAHQVFGHRVAHVPAHDFARVTVQPYGQVEPATALPGQVRDVTDPYPVRGGGGGLAEQAVRGRAHGRVRVRGARHG